MCDTCSACGRCCNKNWLLKLSSEKEIEMFGTDVVFGSYIWTDLCKFLKEGKCTIQEDKPFKCKEYFCEGNLR